MRVALLVLLGLAIGIIGTVFAMNALRERSNPMPHAVMATLGFHRHQLQQSIKGQHCDAAGTLDQLRHLAFAADDIPAAFPDVPPPFLDNAKHLNSAVQNALAAAPADCPALAAALKPVDAACEECHRQYR
jgi:cytochrome c556